MTAVAVPAVMVVAALIAIALGLRHARHLAALLRVWVDGWSIVLSRIPVLRKIPISTLDLPALIKRISIDQWRAIDAETAREPSDAGATSLQVLMVLFTVAASLTLQEYLGGHDSYERLFPPDGSYYWELRGFAWWSGWRFLGYVVIPMIVLALTRQRIRDYHVPSRGFFKHLWLYVVLFLRFAVPVASTTSRRAHTYPFYRIANRSYGDLAMWRALRHSSSRSSSSSAASSCRLRRAPVPTRSVMLVPYCIHMASRCPRRWGDRRRADPRTSRCTCRDLGRRADPRRRRDHDGRLAARLPSMGGAPCLDRSEGAPAAGDPARR
jgi:hypothetical protein